MKGFVGDIESLTKDNDLFRKVIYTGKHLQLVLMTIPPGGEIGEEVHSDTDQFIRIEEGAGKAIIDGVEHDIEDDYAVLVPAGAKHNIVNISDTESLQLYTLYGPAHHKEGTVQATKEEADASDEHFDGVTTE